MLRLDRPQEIPEFDPVSEISQVVTETLIHMADLSATDPVAHLPAPYSLAAEVVGQENLILALTRDPAGVEAFLARLVDRVLAPWCAHLFRKVPSVWLELSDASGSPMFIGPRNFLDIAVAPVLKLRNAPAWGERVFVANYRGDTSRARQGGGARRKRPPAGPGANLEELLDAKRVCCPWFATRLEADTAGVEAYADYCIRHGMRLYVGIGATRTDRNSILDRAAHSAALLSDIVDRAAAVRLVAASTETGHSAKWPGDLYLEDTNAESDLRLIAQMAAVVGT